MSKPDTSAEAVERLAAEAVASLPATDAAGAWCDPLQAPAVIDAMVALDIAATLHALLTERDEARAMLARMTQAQANVVWSRQDAAQSHGPYSWESDLRAHPLARASTLHTLEQRVAALEASVRFLRDKERNSPSVPVVVADILNRVAALEASDAVGRVGPLYSTRQALDVMGAKIAALEERMRNR